MVKRTIENFDIRQICDSGQCFRMAQVKENTYSMVAAGRYLEIEQNGKECTFSCGEEEFEEFWRSYFDLDCDYSGYIESVNPNDKYLMNAVQFGLGIRILHQELWEMTVSFLISQQNNIVRIRRCIQNLCERYGEEKRNFRGERYYTTARSIVQEEISLRKIQEMKYRDAKAELLQLYGVGEKVADCICLFGLHHLEAFPKDTHILQALSKHYKRGFPRRRYKGYEGVMQQYVFYWELKGVSHVPAI